MSLRSLGILISLMSVLAPGCGGPSPRSSEVYETVRRGRDQDTEAAREKNTQAVELIREADYVEAEGILKEALSKDILFGPAHNNLGKTYYHQEKLYLAAWEFQYAIKLMPNRPEPRNNLGLVFEAVGKFDSAVEEYGRALDLEPDNPELLGNLVRAHIRRGDRGNEIRDLLRDLIMKDTRSDWVRWARERLGGMGEADD